MIQRQTEQIKLLSAHMADEKSQRAVCEERLSNFEQTIQAKNGEEQLAAAR